MMSGEYTLRDILDRLNHLNQAHLREFSYSEGLNLRQIESLLYLAKCNRYSNTPLALAEYLGLTKGTISQTLISLVKKKLVTKLSGQKDARIVHLQLTTKAEKIVSRCTSSSQINRALKHSEQITNTAEQNLLDLLRAVQKTNHSRTFAICHSCRFFQANALGDSHRCGLTQEPLYEHESLKICREHTDVSHTN